MIIRHIDDSVRTIGFYGLPGSGTTILASILNSARNCTCYNEPGWKDVIDNKGLETDMHDIIFSGEVEAGEYVAIKETWSILNTVAAKSLVRSAPDLVFQIKRNPISNFNSWKKHGKDAWSDPYIFIRSWTERTSHPTIWYEGLCVDPVGELSKVGLAVIDWVNILHKYDNNDMGDERARMSYEIGPSRCGARECLTDNEVDIVLGGCAKY